MIKDLLIIFALFIIGLVLGSIILLLGINLPKKLKLCNKCDNCDNKWHFFELIPIVPYFINRFRCRYCGNNISRWNVVIEILSGILLPFSYIIYGFSYEMIAMILISILMLLIFVTDFKYYIILDSSIIVISFSFLSLKFIFFGWKTFLLSLASGALMIIFLTIIKFIGDKLFKTESLGWGDVKLSFVFGSALGIRLSIISIVLGSFLAFPYAVYSSFNKIEREIPFGPFLVSGFLVVFIFMEQIKYFISILLGIY